MEPEVQENELSESVTGRDGYIVALALYEAIKFLSALPEKVRPWSDIQDMKLMLQETCDAGLVELFVAQDNAARLVLEGKVGTVFPSWERRPVMEKPPRRAMSPPAIDHLPHQLASRWCGHHFFRRASRVTSFSSSDSASSFFSLVFSVSNSRRRLASEALMPPNLLRHK